MAIRSSLARALVAAAVLAGAPIAAETPPPAPRLTSYRNPVLPGFYPDPSVARVGDWFYLVNSSFEFFPGVPLHRSRDLVHWEPLGNVLTRESQLPLETAAPSGGIFAPTIRFHAGTFYVVTTNVSHRGSFFVTAQDPAGPWSEPVWLDVPGGGIDPSLFFDDDGKVYLTSTGSVPGIFASQLDVASGKLLTAPRLVWKGTGGRYPEGPHLHKIGGRYYLMISEGGTEYGHMVTIARASSPWGPFEPCPRNPILTHRNTPLDQPIQATGHADLVQDGEGKWWMVFLGIRPQGGYYWHHLGRETFLAPVRWDAQGWPVVNEGQPIALDMHVQGLPAAPVPAAPARDDFDGPALGPDWIFLRDPVRANYSITERPGWLTLHGTPVSLERETGASPTFVARRQQHLTVRMATRIDFAPRRDGEEAGLVLYRAPHARYELGVRRRGAGREVFVRQTVGADVSVVTATARIPAAGPLMLQIDAAPTRYTFAWQPAPDRAGGQSAPPASLGAAETRLLATEVTGGFIGTTAGLYARTADGDPTPPPAAFDWFDYQPQP
ncbi:MAG TPA: glycoside hydrolase family 43 protein [Polyangia bacterium]|nr:glycoside hydrolase family 43 protein [Polyangia bacterium]